MSNLLLIKPLKITKKTFTESINDILFNPNNNNNSPEKELMENHFFKFFFLRLNSIYSKCDTTSNNNEIK